MTAPVQPYLFSQIGLDSGALTILGGVVHRFPDPGHYRGVVTSLDGRTSVFQLTADESQAAIPVNIDLAAIVQGSASPRCQCSAGHNGQPHFVVRCHTPVMFHVSGGPGGYAVHVSPGAEEPKRPVFDSRQLGGGDLFAATILRSGLYTVTNTLARKWQGRLDGSPDPEDRQVRTQATGCSAGRVRPRRVRAVGDSSVRDARLRLRVRDRGTDQDRARPTE